MVQVTDWPVEGHWMSHSLGGVVVFTDHFTNLLVARYRALDLSHRVFLVGIDIQEDVLSDRVAVEIELEVARLRIATGSQQP